VLALSLSYLDRDKGHRHLKYLQAAAVVGVFGFFVCSVGFILSTRLAVRSAITRMGAERPKSLLPSAGGGWDVDASRGYVVLLFLGEVEVHEKPVGVGAQPWGSVGVGVGADIQSDPPEEEQDLHYSSYYHLNGNIRGGSSTAGGWEERKGSGRSGGSQAGQGRGF